MKRFLAVLPYVFFSVCFSSAPGLTQAAALYIDPATNEVKRGDAITMAVRLDVDEESGECVNAVDGVITYTSNIEPVDISTGDSIFNIWVEAPVINREERTISFAGGIPNGYCGRVMGDPRLTNVLTEIIFRSPGFSVGGSAETEAQVSFVETTTAYLNDGRGTKASLATYGAKVSLNPNAGAVMNNDWKDEVNNDLTPPEKFSISLQKDDQAFSQKYYIVFNSSDKQTGIDHYEVMEEELTQVGSFQWGRADAPWVASRSPHVLADQSLNSIIRVKAVDKAGNEYIANLVPEESMRTLSHTQAVTMATGGGILLLILVIGLTSLWVVVKRRRRKADKQNEKESELLDEQTDNNDNYEE